MGGSLNDDELLNIKKRGQPYSNIKNFVETGTYKGDSTLIAANHFDNVYTIEIFEPLYLESKQRAKDENVNNITFFLGDSLEKLREITPLVTEGAIFFIDAHISGADSGWNNTTRVPLIEELNIILSEPVGPSVFIFDDLRLWTGQSKAWDWSHITNDTIIQKFKNNGFNVACFFEENDRFYVFTK